MPLYEFDCIDCGVYEIRRPMKESHVTTIACKCGQLAVRVPSATGYRYDHTIKGDKNEARR